MATFFRYPLSIGPFCAFMALVCSPFGLGAQSKTQKLYDKMQQERVVLPNQWQLTPAGSHLPLGDLPLNAVVSPSKKYMAVTHNGVGRQHIQTFDVRQFKPIADAPVAKSWYGLAFTPDERYLLASGGNDNTIIIFKHDKGQLQRDTVIALAPAAWPTHKVCPTGLAAANGFVYAVTKEDSALYQCDLTTQKVVKKVSLGSEAYAIQYAHNRLFVSLWGAKTVAFFDANTLELQGHVAVGDHPTDLVLTADGSLLYVANSLDNSVSVVDVAAKREIEVLNAALYPNAPNGSTTNSVALSSDEKTLFVANADNNCLAVFDVSTKAQTTAKGFIPTGWYPTTVRTVGRHIFVTNGKGLNSLANPDGPSPLKKREDSRAAAYIGALFKGSLSRIKWPKKEEWGVFSQLVYENTPYTKEKERQVEGEKGNPIPKQWGDTSPIKYVFYIIKENRTYDQVLGDVKEGNGDPTLCLFPEKVTPNQHKIVRDFVLLDNFYVDAEVSADGHNWSMAAYANDFVEKTWPTSYGGRGGNYDFEGQRRIAYPKSGFLWDNCLKQGVSYRTYGEFADDGKAAYQTLEGHICPNYSAWDMNYQDIRRQQDWQRDFDSLLAIGQLPQFSVVRFGNDHTSGLAKGAYSPFAAVADNDLAVGRFVEHVAASKIWPQSAIFILEDDAQNGADHVDAHRSTAYLISPYVKRRFVDHTLYSTSSMVRTMELILGLPPMSQYDAAATPMWRSFTAQPDFTPFQSVPAQVDIHERNTADNILSRQSAFFNLTQLDAVPETLFNEVLWKAIKGIEAPLPPLRRAAFVKVRVAEAEEED